MLLRPFDEAIELTKYFLFVVVRQEPAVSHVREWFRENRSPKHKIVREMWGKKIDAILGQQGGNSAQLFQLLYFKKSKELHHSYSGIRENHKEGMVGSVLKITGFDYGPSSSPRKIWEVVGFFALVIEAGFAGFVGILSPSGRPS